MLSTVHTKISGDMHRSVTLWPAFCRISFCRTLDFSPSTFYSELNSPLFTRSDSVSPLTMDGFYHLHPEQTSYLSRTPRTMSVELRTNSTMKLEIENLSGKMYILLHLKWNFLPRFFLVEKKWQIWISLISLSCKTVISRCANMYWINSNSLL